MKMETETKQTVSEATGTEHVEVVSAPTWSQDQASEHTPARSSVSSDRTSLSHGFSPIEEKTPVSPPAVPTSRLPAHPGKPPSSQTVINHSVREGPAKAMTKAHSGVGEGLGPGVLEEGDHVGGTGRVKPSLSMLRRAKRVAMVKKTALGFRVCAMLFCLVSFSVMAADTDKGWALDSFDRYKEFRYCLSVNVIGFVYSGAQAYYMAYHSATGKYVAWHQLRHYIDFSVDQILSYLLISAASSAATRIDDWQSNWGKDKFPEMATASVVMSFLAFLALASSSIISGYTTWTSIAR